MFQDEAGPDDKESSRMRRHDFEVWKLEEDQDGKWTSKIRQAQYFDYPCKKWAKERKGSQEDSSSRVKIWLQMFSLYVTLGKSLDLV